MSTPMNKCRARQRNTEFTAGDSTIGAGYVFGKMGACVAWLLSYEHKRPSSSIQDEQ